MIKNNFVDVFCHNSVQDLWSYLSRQTTCSDAAIFHKSNTVFCLLNYRLFLNLNRELRRLPNCT